MTRLLRELDRLDAGHPRPRSAARVRGDVRRRVTATALALGLVVVIGGAFAHKQWGLTITADGLRLATPLGTPPEVAGGILASAVEEISAATGLAFRVGGTTDE